MPPFCWASIPTLDKIRDQWETTRPSALLGLGVYHALTELANERRARSSIGKASDDFKVALVRFAEKAGVADVHAIGRALRELERIGVVKVERSRKKLNVVRLCEATMSLRPISIKENGTSDSRSVNLRPTVSGEVRTSGSSVQEAKEQEAAAARDPDLPENYPEQDADFIAAVVQVFDAWKLATGRDGSTRLTDPRKQAIVNALGMYEPHELEHAIGNWKRSDWFSGRKPRDKRVRNDLVHQLRDGEVIEELRDLGKPRATKATKPAAPAPESEPEPSSPDELRGLLSEYEETLKATSNPINREVLERQAAGIREQLEAAK